jgi:hypothetical protein
MSSSLNKQRDPWSRLTTAARNVSDDRDTTVPYGFATRIAALALAQEQRVVSLFDRFALRALGVACLLALGSVALNYRSLTTTASATESFASTDEVMLPAYDAVAVVLDIAD